jgi:hypothetical protein
MLILFSTGGSQRIRLIQPMASEFWEPIKHLAVRLLRQSMPSAAQLLEKYPFEIWQGTNDFGDEFELLYLNAPLNNYLEIEQRLPFTKMEAKAIAAALEKLNRAIRFVAVDIDTDHKEVVSAPTLKITSDVVERALSDFATLAHSKGGAISGVDRLHTALHGYFEAVCDVATIAYNPDSSITALFSLIRQHHPALQRKPPGTEAEKIFRAMAQIVDILNPVRNQKSMAHPSEALLEEPEAMLVANSVRTLLHYLNSKLGK